MCFKDGALRAYLDGELPARESERVAAHLAECPRCRERVERLKADENLVEAILNRSLNAAGVRREDLPAAWAGLRNEGRPGTIWEGVRKEMRRFKVAVAVAATVCALAVPFTFPPVRAMATEFLNIFRVERVHVISISGQEWAQIEKALSGQGPADIEEFGRIATSGEPEYRTGLSPDEARQAVGPGFKVPAAAGGGEPSWGVMTGFTLTIAPKVEAINGLLAQFGSDRMLPESLDGKEFTLRQHPVATAEFTRPDGRKVVVAQGKSPELTVPEGTDVLALRDALLGLPFLPDNVRRQLEAVSDWQHTVLIPSVKGEARPVRVNGTEGAFLDGHGGDNGLLWAADGLIYMVGGTDLTLDEALAVAASLR
ncbi:MAG: zf-HC2 domain-containing protein [Thermoanaerobacterales bacterium]|nr:zf-HC2 domain-containing protein [Thermoanaerobacterales bacterium]